jgi:hypothetical protein
MNPAVVQWLASPASYAAGVALYQQLGGSSVYQQLFAQGETAYSRQLLVQQLEQHVTCPPLPTAAGPSAAPMVPPAPIVEASAPVLVNEAGLP